MARARIHDDGKSGERPAPTEVVNAHCKAILNSVPDQAWLKDMDSRYLAVNEPYTKACGLSEGRIIGRRPLDVWPSDIAMQYLATDREVLSSGHSKRYEEQRPDQRGKLRWYETIKVPTRDINGAIIGSAGISRDISHLKKIERELRASRTKFRNLSSYLQTVREEERTRISRELHDELGQNLTALGFGLDWVEAQLRPDQESIAVKLGELRQLAGATVASMAKIAAELRPAILDDLGLAAAIENMVDAMAKRSALEIALRIEPSVGSCPPETSTAIFRILQESLTNIVRHAQAMKVSIILEEVENEIILKVRDDGRGLPPDMRRHEARGLGLLGMQERACMVGGTLSIESKLGCGTQLILRVPGRFHRENRRGTSD